MILGSVIGSRDIGLIDGFNVYVFWTKASKPPEDRPMPDRSPINFYVVAERDGISLGMVQAPPFSGDPDMRAVWLAIEMARTRLGTIIR